jgi:hypothetical protein
VPVSPHLSDLQPPGEPREFQYLNLALLVRLTSTGPMHALGVGWVEMYGSAYRRETIVSLKPGQWVRVDAKVKLHTWPSHPSEAQLRGDFWLRNKTFKPGDKRGLRRGRRCVSKPHFASCHRSAFLADPFCVATTLAI